MAHRKQPERRTFLQDRFEILIRRQKSGTATFNELTELDEIVNRDPEIREKVIRESMLMEEISQSDDGPTQAGTNANPHTEAPPRHTAIARVRAFLNRLFLSKTIVVKQGLLALREGQMILI